MTLCLCKNLQGVLKENLLKLNSEFSRFTEYKVNTPKLIVFLCINNRKLDNQILKIAFKDIKYLTNVYNLLVWNIVEKKRRLNICRYV